MKCGEDSIWRLVTCQSDLIVLDDHMKPAGWSRLAGDVQPWRRCQPGVQEACRPPASLEDWLGEYLLQGFTENLQYDENQSLR